VANLPYLFIGFVAIGAALAILTVWARRGLWVRAGAVVLLLAIVSLQYVAVVDLLSRPKPTGIEFFPSASREAIVLAATIDEGQAIYVWLRLPELREPRYYALPWNLEDAKALNKAIRNAGRHGSRIIMRLPFDELREESSPRRFYDVPRKALAHKPVPDMMEYRHPSLTL